MIKRRLLTCMLILTSISCLAQFDNSNSLVRKMLLEYEMDSKGYYHKKEGALVRDAVNASLDANVRTPEIQVEGGAKYGTKEVGEWIVNYIKNA